MSQVPTDSSFYKQAATAKRRDGIRFRIRSSSRVLLIILLQMIVAREVYGQDWRLSAGYFIEHYDLNYEIHPLFDGVPAYTNKGGLELELERYLLHRFYIAASTNLLLHNQETIFLGGPIDFKAFSIGGSLGYQWSKFGVYGGVQAGRVWDLQFRGYRNEEPVSFSTSPSGDASAWTTALRGGFKYYLMRYVRLHAELIHNYNQPRSMMPVPEGGGYPETRIAGFTPTSFRVGVSVSIPWSSHRRVERIRQQGRLPVMMEVAGVNFRSPMQSAIVTSNFGTRWGRPHEGVDLQARRGDHVLAASNGVVIEARRVSGYGRMIKIRHANNYSTRYAHLNSIRVREGQSVRAGDVIGTAGSSGNATGVHLHFELLREGLPVDPRRYIQF